MRRPSNQFVAVQFIAALVALAVGATAAPPPPVLVAGQQPERRASPGVERRPDGGDGAAAGRALAGAPDAVSFTGGKVEFRGVSFSYDPSVGPEVKAEVVAARPLRNKDDKPDHVRPEHTSFKLSGPYAARHGESFFGPPEINVYAVGEYKRAFAVEPRYARDVDARVRELKSLLSRRPKKLAKETPFLDYVEGSQLFRAHVRYVNFKNGSGVFLLTQYAFEPTLVNNRALVYVFQGLTDDGRHWVSATFPVSTATLPDDFSNEEARRHGLDFAAASTPASDKKHDAYVAATARRLEKLPPGEYRPRLTLFDDLIRSLSVHPQE